MQYTAQRAVLYLSGERIVRRGFFGDLWKEAAANAVILQLPGMVEGRRPDRMVEELRDVAIAIGEERPGLTVRLLRLAVRLRPDGSVIRRKLAEYTERQKAVTDVEGGAEPDATIPRQ